MPQLPSGRYIGFEPAPLNELLSDADNHHNIVKIMEINDIPTLMEWLTINYFVAPEETNDKGTPAKLAKASQPLPPGYISIPSGYRLSNWEELAADWINEDKAALLSLLSEDRFIEYMNYQLSVVKQYQERYLNSDNLITKVAAFFWKAGVHPDQLDGADEIWGDETSPEWDIYDMLTALNHIVTCVKVDPQTYQEHSNAFDRASGMLQMLYKHHPFLLQSFASDVSVREIAQTWRQENNLAELSDADLSWLQKQMIIECVNLWNVAGETLEHACPKAYAIITLVTLSPEGAAES